MCECDQTDSPLLPPGGRDTAHSILQGAVCIGCSQVALCFQLKEEDWYLLWFHLAGFVEEDESAAQGLHGENQEYCWIYLVVWSTGV